MRFLQYDEDSQAVTLNYMWLPTWLGMNAAFKRDVEAAFRGKIEGASTADLDALEEELLDYIVKRHPAVPGLRDYLDGIKFVEA